MKPDASLKIPSIAFVLYPFIAFVLYVFIAFHIQSDPSPRPWIHLKELTKAMSHSFVLQSIKTATVANTSARN